MQYKQVFLWLAINEVTMNTKILCAFQYFRKKPLPVVNLNFVAGDT